jgi:Tol biopolymer transport system component
MKRMIIKSGILCFIVIFFAGCVETNEYDYVDYRAPNWTSDGKIVFVKDSNHLIEKRGLFSYESNSKGSSEVYTLCEIDSDGSGYKEIGVLLESYDYAYSLRLTNTSSIDDWVVLGMQSSDQTEEHVYVIKRDGTGLQEVGEGRNPDFSPDASRIVYEKPNQGIWIMDRDGGNDRQIISKSEAIHPAWSADGEKIAYTRSDSLGIFIGDTVGNLILVWKGDSVRPIGSRLDWGPLDSNSVIVRGEKNGDYGFVILKVDSLQKCTFTKYHNGFYTFYYKWSSDGDKLIAHDENGWFIVNISGTNKWYLNP